MPNSTSFAIISRDNITNLINNWKQHNYLWPVMDTPMYQSDTFQESVLYLFLGSLIHYQLEGITEDKTFYCYRKQNSEGSVAYWRTLRAHWPVLRSYKLSYAEFAQIFDGLKSLPERFTKWSKTLHALRQKYNGQVTTFLESCQWNISSILERTPEEFPAFREPSNSNRIHLFLYLVQGKYFSSSLFNGIDKIQPYLDPILLAGLIQTDVLQLPSNIDFVPSDKFNELINTAEYALEELLTEWRKATTRKILPADINTPLRQLGMMSIWRYRFPLRL